MIAVLGNVTHRSFNAYSVNADGDVVRREIFPHMVETSTSAWASELGWDSQRAEKLAAHLNAIMNDILPRKGVDPESLPVETHRRMPGIVSGTLKIGDRVAWIDYGRIAFGTVQSISRNDYYRSVERECAPDCPNCSRYVGGCWYAVHQEKLRRACPR